MPQMRDRRILWRSHGTAPPPHSPRQDALKTSDLCDAHGEKVAVCHPIFRDFGGRAEFSGRVSTVKCFEDNSKVAETLSRDGDGGVLVVDAGGSLRCAVVGDVLAGKAITNHWVGIVVFGCIRDAAELACMDIGIKALSAHPRRSVKRGQGEVNVSVSFAAVTFEPGHYVYCDIDGIVVTRNKLG